MAIYHLNAAVFARSKGQSSTAAAAYRAGCKIVDERTGQVHDYTRRGGVVSAALVLPGGRTEDRAQFWNRLEQHHRRGDAVVAREIEVSLPHELDAGQRETLAREYARDLADRYGVACDVAIHEPHKKGGDERNVHAHILISACTVAADGTLGKKCTALDPVAAKCENAARAKRGEPALPMPIEAERERWAARCNRALEAAGVQSRVDHRSLAEQARDHLARGDVDLAAALTRAPTVHEGKATTAARRQGHVLERAAMNDVIRLDNRAAIGDYLKQAGKEGRVVDEQQKVDDVTGSPVKKRQVTDDRDVATRRQHPGRRLGSSLGDATGARGRSGPAVHAERAQAAMVAKGPDGGKSKEQKHEEARAAEAGRLMQKWMAGVTRLAEMYLEDVGKAMADERKRSQVATQIYEKIRAMAEASGRKEAWTEFRAESAKWRKQRRHMRQVVHYGDEQRRLDARHKAHRRGMKKWGETQAVLHNRTVDERMGEWAKAHPEPGKLLHREQWMEWDKKRQRYLHVLETAEADRRRAAKAIMSDAQQRDAAIEQKIIDQRQAALEAKRRERWPVAADLGQMPEVHQFGAKNKEKEAQAIAATLAQAVRPEAVPPPVPPMPPPVPPPARRRPTPP